MLIDGLTLIEGTSVANLVVTNGSDFPTTPDKGELFYLILTKEFFPEGLYVYSGTEWTQVATSTQLNEIATAATVVTAGTTFPSPAVNGELFYKSTADITGDVGLYVYQASDSQWHAVSSGAEITNHINDTSVHLTSTQNTLLDAITVSSSEINYLSGATSSIQTQLNNKLSSSGGTISGNIVVPTGYKVTIADAPSSSTDAVNKSYVDSNLAGLSWKNSVKVATTANITLSGTQTIDGISVVAGDRVLVKNQTSTSQNGIYIVASGSWSRATDMDSTTPINEVNSAAVFVEQGTQADTGWTQINAVSTLGTDAVSFTQFNGAAGITAGIGLEKSGNTLNVLLGAGIAELPTDEIGIDLLSGSGLFLTEDGTTDSTATGAKIAVKLDGTSLTRSANGLKVSDGGITAAKIASSALGSTLVGGSGSVINLAPSGVTAGTATKVTVDTYGRVTSGSTLLESDIPNLSWSKITSGTPTTLAGYGITDAAPSSHINDATLHLTSAQNTWLDSITATSAEVNYLSGVTSAIQTQLDGKQSLDGDLTAIAALSGTTGFLKKTAANTWSLDTSTYITGNQTITLTGAVTGSGTTSINTVLADSGVTLGTYRSVTVNAKGIVTSGSNPTTLAGYGITDAVNTSVLGVANGVATLDSAGLIPSSQLPSYVDDVLEYANLAAFPVSGTTGKIYVAQDTSKIYRWSGSVYIEISPTAGNADTATKLATARSISATGDATWSVSFDGSTNVSAALTLANSGVTAGTYKSVTVDAKGRVTAGTNPTTLAGYGITDALTTSQVIDGGSF